MRWRLVAAFGGVVVVVVVALVVPLAAHLRRVERDRELNDMNTQAATRPPRSTRTLMNRRLVCGVPVREGVGS